MKKLLFLIFTLIALKQIFAQSDTDSFNYFNKGHNNYVGHRDWNPIHYKLKCACIPKKSTTNIFTQHNLKSKWKIKSNSVAKVGKGWTFFVDEEIYSHNIFLKGHYLNNPQGFTMNVENGIIFPLYVLKKEWMCVADESGGQYKFYKLH